MDKEQALHSFWSSFGIPAYEESSVPDETSYPYMTYQKMSGAFEDDLYPVGSIWTRKSSWSEADAIKAQIEAKFEHGTHLIKIDGGYLAINRGKPFAQSQPDDGDRMIKRYIISLAVEYLTAK